MNVLKREKYDYFPQAIRMLGGKIKKLCYLLESISRASISCIIHSPILSLKDEIVKVIIVDCSKISMLAFFMLILRQ